MTKLKPDDSSLLAEDIAAVAHRVAGESNDLSIIKAALPIMWSGNLKHDNRYAEAGRVLLDYAQDVEASIAALCEGSEFSEAIRIVRSLTSR